MGDGVKKGCPVLDESASLLEKVKELQKREDQVIESILENEQLTADLDDGAAQVLLNWGVACAKRIARGTAALAEEGAQEAIASRLRATRRLMRRVNRLVANQGQLEPGRGAALLSGIVDQARIIYGERYTPPDIALREAFSRKHSEHVVDPAQFIAELREFIEDPPDTPSPKRKVNAPAKSERRRKTRRKRSDAWQRDIPD
jgi:hypothetical protein